MILISERDSGGAMELFSRNPFHQKLRTHKLSGKLEGLWAFSVCYDYRVVFEFLNGDEVLLVDIEVMKKFIEFTQRTATFPELVCLQLATSKTVPGSMF